MRDLKQLPKADLHCHLEGSARPDTIKALAQKYGTTLGSSQDFNDLASFLKKFEEARSVIRSVYDLERIASEFIEDTAASGGVYCEIDWAPHFYTRLEDLQGGTEEAKILEVFERVHQAMLKAADTTHVQFGHLLGVDKSNPKQAEAIARFGVTHKNKHIVSFGFAGNEAIPHSTMQEAVKIALAGGLKFIPHAGEVLSAESVDEVLDFAPNRIAHGFRSLEDPKTLSRLREAGIPCDIALSSNVGLGIVASLKDHPAKTLLSSGIAITLNTDDSLFFGSSLLDEYTLARSALGLDDTMLALIAANSIVFSGGDEMWKGEQLKKINEWLAT